MNRIANDDDRMTAFDYFLIAAIMICIFLLIGCAAERKDKAQTDTVRHETTTIDCSIPLPVFMTDGMHTIDVPIHLTMQRDASEQAKTDATRTTSLSAPEFTNLLKAGLAQFAPGLGALLAPTPVQPSDHTGAIIGGIGTLSALLAALAKARADAKRLAEKDTQIEYHKASEDEAYKQLAAKA